MNANLPPIEVCVNNKFLFTNELAKGYSWGHLISVRALQNQAPQISVLLYSGALYTGLPIHAIGFKEERLNRPLEDVIMWDNISSTIQVITLDTLRYMPCTVKTEKEIISGEYLFTLDYVGNNDLSRSAEHWKQTHVIMADDGDMLIYPQYRIRFKDPALCFRHNEPYPKYKHNDINWKVGR